MEWAKAFNCPVYVSREDEKWLNRVDNGNLRRFIEGPTETIVPGVTAIKAGGHFDGSLCLHWDKKLLHADTLMAAPVGSSSALLAKSSADRFVTVRPLPQRPPARYYQLLVHVEHTGEFNPLTVYQRYCIV